MRSKLDRKRFRIRVFFRGSVLVLFSKVGPGSGYSLSGSATLLAVFIFGRMVCTAGPPVAIGNLGLWKAQWNFLER